MLTGKVLLNSEYASALVCLNGIHKTDSSRLLDGEFQRPRNGKKNDKAHPPIHPTAHASNLDADERRVFELVTRRFLASCHKNAEGKTTTVEVEIADELFFTTGPFLLALCL